MKLTISVKLMPTVEQESIIKETLKAYIQMVNGLVAEFVVLDKLEKKTSADINCAIPSALKSQSIQDARSVFQKYRKEDKNCKSSCTQEACGHLEQPELLRRRRQFSLSTLDKWQGNQNFD